VALVVGFTVEVVVVMVDEDVVSLLVFLAPVPLVSFCVDSVCPGRVLARETQNTTSYHVAFKLIAQQTVGNVSQSQTNLLSSYNQPT